MMPPETPLPTNDGMPDAWCADPLTLILRTISDDTPTGREVRDVFRRFVIEEKTDYRIAYANETEKIKTLQAARNPFVEFARTHGGALIWFVR